LINVACMKWGQKYPASYVNNLYRGVTRWMDRDFRFLCFTDDTTGLDAGIETRPMPVEPFADAFEYGRTRKGRKGAWRKISLLKPGLAGMTGQLVIFDIDVVITGPLGPIVDHAPDKVAFRREWRYARLGLQGGHGSVYTFKPELHPYLYDEFAADPVGSIDRHKGSEQYYTSMTALRHGSLSYLPDELVCSYKRDLLPAFPLNLIRQPELTKACSVLCFHGQPGIDEAINGVSHPLRYRAKPCDWLRDYWAA
jgi:hypothetical protein